MKQNKFIYCKVIQSNFGYGWDDEVTYNTANNDEMNEYKSDIKAYRQNARENGYRIRTIERRVKNTAIA